MRVDEANRLRDEKPARKVVKSASWMLLHNRANLKKPEDAVRLDKLLAANQALTTLYVLKDDLKDLWRQASVETARTAWRAWFDKSIASGLKPLIHFPENLVNYLDGIVASTPWHLNTSLLEGINNKIKVTKRMAYGFRMTPTSSSKSAPHSPENHDKPIL